MLAFGACAMLGIVIAWPRERLLTETAHSVMKMNPEKQTLCWLSVHRLIPKFNPRPIYTESVWISRTDGHGMQELGHVPTHLDENGTPQDLLRDVRWLPDGRQISFVYEGTLYVMPAVCEK